MKEVEKDPNVEEPFAVCTDALAGKIQGAKVMVMKLQAGNMKLLTPKKKKKKGMDNFLLMETMTGKIDDMKLNLIKVRLSSLRKASLTMDEEAELKKILSSIAGEEVDDKRRQLATKMLMLEDVKSLLLEDPDNKTLEQELDMKENDVKWMIEDILRDDRKSKGIITDSVMAKLTAKLLTAEEFEESKHSRDESGEFTSGEGGGKEKKKEKGGLSKDQQEKTDQALKFIVDNPDATVEQVAEFSHMTENEVRSSEQISEFSHGLGENLKPKSVDEFNSERNEETRKKILENAGVKLLSYSQDFDGNFEGLRGADKDRLEKHLGVGEFVKAEKESQKRKSTPKESDMAFRGVDDMVTDGRITKEQGEEAKRRIKTERNLASIRKTNPEVADAFENAIVAEEEMRAQEEALNALPKSEQKRIREFQQLVEQTKLENSLSKKDREALSKFKELRKLKKGKLESGSLRTGSLVDEYHTASGDRYVTYFLLNDDTNLKGWGVTAKSIPQHIGTFKNMPFVITKTKFFPRSAYGEVTDHPSTEHFKKLGIKVGRDRPKQRNDMMQQASFQEEFRVGNIDEIVRSANGDWLAFIKIKPQFADYEMPPLVSPAIFQLNPMEPMDNISTWVGMHLAGLDESPAYGNNALYKGSCFGDKGTCMTQLSAKLPKLMAYLPPCAMKKMYNARMKVAEMKIAVMISTDPGRAETQRQEILCRKDGKLAACPQNTAKKIKVYGMRERSAGGPGSGSQKGREPINPFRQPDRPSSGTESGGRRKSIGRKPINPARPLGGKLEVFGTHPWGSRKKPKK